MTVILLLPVFFVATGLNVRVNDLKASQIPLMLVILATAVVGKFVGATLAARAQRIPWRKAGAIGTLMNTRGLTELVILNVGREKGVLDSELFTMLVVMAVITTVMTEPLLRIFYPDRLLQRDVADAARHALEAESFKVVALLEDGADAGALVDVAAAVVGPFVSDIPAELVVTRFTPFHVSSPDTQLGEGLGLGRQLEEMATSIGQLHDLTARAEAQGVRVSVYNQFSDDLASDLLAHLVTVDAHLLLVAPQPDGSTSALDDRLLAEAPCDVGIVRAGAAATGGGWVAASAAGGADGAAVAELAARVAIAHDVPVLLLDDDGRAGRRLGLVQRHLARIDVGVAADEGAIAATADRGAPWPLVLAPADHAPARDGADRTVIVLRGKEGSDDTRLEQFVATVREVDGERRLRAAAEFDAQRALEPPPAAP
jgi:hypothetical protein